MRALPEQLTRYIPGDYFVLGTDGMGRSETREALRRHFEIDGESIALAALYRLAKAGVLKMADVAKAIKELDYNPRRPIRCTRKACWWIVFHCAEALDKNKVTGHPSALTKSESIVETNIWRST